MTDALSSQRTCGQRVRYVGAAVAVLPVGMPRTTLFETTVLNDSAGAK